MWIYTYPTITKGLTYPKLSVQSIERVRNLLFDLTHVLEESSVLSDDRIHLGFLFFVLPLLGIPDHQCTINVGCAVTDLVTLLDKPCCLNKLSSCLCTRWLSDKFLCFLTVSSLIIGFKLYFDSKILGMKH